MPFTLLAHQAPVLPLKLWRPHLVCGTALLIGSMAPDLEYVLLRQLDPVHGHRLLGQLYYCMPLTVILTLLVRRVAGTLGANLPDLGALHLRDVHVMSRARLDLRDLVRIVTSALIGSFSHIALDAFTHRNGWGVERVLFLKTYLFSVGGEPIWLYRALQLGGSLVLAVACAAMALHVGRRRLLCAWYGARTDEAPAPRQPLLFWLVTLAAGIAPGMYCVWLVLPLRRFSEITWFGYALLQAMCWLLVGVTLGTIAAALRERFPRRAASGVTVRP